MLVVNLLGDLRVYQHQQPVEITSRPAQALLAYLLLNRGASHPRERIAGQLWPDAPESSARQNLRSALYLLRKAIGEEYLIAGPSSIAFNTRAPFSLDIDLLDDERQAGDLDAAMRSIAVYQADLLPGFDEEWLLPERERLRALFERRMESLLSGLVAGQRWDETLAWAERWIALGETPEPAYRAIMTAHAARNDLSGLARSYQRCVRDFETNLGVSPSQETLQLFEQLRERATLANSAAAAPRANGETTAVLPELPLPARDLPRYDTSFIGREREVAEIRARLVDDPNCRLLSLTGPGGIGKTRLAVEAAGGLPFTDGVWFLSTAALDHSAALVNHLITLFGLPAQAGEPTRQRLQRFLSRRSLLLVLDNFEDLLAGGQTSAAQEAVDLIGGLLHACPGVKIMLTSRERLNLSLEWVFPVGGLAVENARQLFLQRARQAGRSLAGDPAVQTGDLGAVQRICELVGGLPLAIEMAAAWARVLSFSEIADEIQQGLEILSTSLRDVPLRHQKIRGVFDASWQRLAPTEQAFFRRLSAFQGSFSRQAAAQVCLGDGLDGSDPSGASSTQSLSLLAGLVEKSFLQTAGTDRFTVHELLRQYGESWLARSGEETLVRDRHARYYLAFLSNMEAAVKTGDQRRALDSVASELNNILAAWYWAARQGHLSLMIQAMETLWLFYIMRRYALELYTVMNRTLELLDQPGFMDKSGVDQQLQLLTGMIFTVQSGSQMMAGNYTSAAEWMERAFQILDECRSKRWLALATNWMAVNQLFAGQLEEARRLLVRSIDISRQVDDLWLLGYSLNDLGLITHRLGQTDEAQALTRQSLEFFTANADRRGMAFAYSNLGLYASHLGCLEDALGYYEACRQIRAQNDDLLGLANVLLRQGPLYGQLGDMDNARRILEEAARAAHTMQFLPVLVEALVELAFLDAQAGEMVRARRVLSICLAHPSLNRDTGEKARELDRQLTLAGYPYNPVPLAEAAFEEEVRLLLSSA